MKIVNIVLDDDQTRPVQAWETDTPGLVITSWASDEITDKDHYSVTHEPSGQVLTSWRFYSFDIARLFVAEIDGYVDWTLDGAKLKKALEKVANDEERREGFKELAKSLEEKVEKEPFKYLPKLSELRNDL